MWPSNFNLYIAVLILFNIFWIFTYVLTIRRGYLDKIWAVPMVSLALNLAWDFAGSLIVPSPMSQNLMNAAFLICNLIITAQLLIYWRSKFSNISQDVFYGGWFAMQVFAVSIIIAGSKEMNDPNLVEIGFVDNFINSAFFIGMFYSREGLRGQSIYIALNKLLGTGAISLSWYIFPWPGTTPSTMIFLTWAIFSLDALYVFLVWKRAQSMKIDVWSRW